MKKKVFKSTISLLLGVLMIFGGVQFGAFAEGEIAPAAILEFSK